MNHGKRIINVYKISKAIITIIISGDAPGLSKEGIRWGKWEDKRYTVRDLKRDTRKVPNSLRKIMKGNKNENSRRSRCKVSNI